MFGNPMLDVAIGLVFFYLLLSIIVTVLQEFITSSVRLRNKTLLKALDELFGDAKNENVRKNRKDFYRHPLIYPLFKGEVDDNTGKPRKHGPDYIPSRNFALAILDLQANRDRPVQPAVEAQPAVAAQPEATAQPEVAAQPEPAFDLARFFTNVPYGAGLRARLDRFDRTASEVIDKIGNSAVKQAATSALTSAVGELKTATDVVDTAVKELENLFNSSMDRAAGWYKVRAQWIALGIAVVLAAALNADSIYVGQRLWGDEALRNQAVAAAEAYYQSRQGQQQLTSLCSAVATDQPAPTGAAETSATVETTDQATPERAAETGATEPNADQWKEVKDCTQREIKEAISQLNAAGYPIGWAWQDQSAEPQNEDGARLSIGSLRGQPNQTLPGAILGILLTGLAVSLGSSFWFDLLGKFMNVRMTGKREDTATPPPERPSAGERTVIVNRFASEKPDPRAAASPSAGEGVTT